MKDIVEINRKEIVVDAVLEELDSVTDYISEYLAEMGCSTPMEIKICIACEEIFVNIANYAYEKMGSEVPRMACVALSQDPSGNNVQITFRDRGISYNPLEKEDPDITLSAAERQIGGLGIFMVKKSMDKVLYERDGNENVLMLIKNIKE